MEVICLLGCHGEEAVSKRDEVILKKTGGGTQYLFPFYFWGDIKLILVKYYHFALPNCTAQFLKPLRIQ